jgi:hypothetical protein
MFENFLFSYIYVDSDKALWSVHLPEHDDTQPQDSKTSEIGLINLHGTGSETTKIKSFQTY